MTDLYDLAFARNISGGGSGGTTDYTDLTNKPKINGVTLSGDKSAADLSLATNNPATVSTLGLMKPDGVTTTISADGTLHAAYADISSWYGVRAIVRAGLAPSIFQVGDQLTCMRGADELVWDIVNITDHDITLLLHEAMPDMVYGAKQAIFAFPSGLAAGDYHFTVAQHPWVAGDVGKTLTFTLTQAIPEGGQLVLNGTYNATLVGTTISSYASPTTTTAIETMTMTEGDSGTDLGSLTNAGTPASNINSLQKALLGSNEWKTSAQRQWLNSNGAAGRVWVPQTIYDRPPLWATNTAGFMVGLDEDFLSCVSPTIYVTIRNTVSDGGGTDTLTDKFYLPSRTEIFGSDEIANTPEGTLYAYYQGATNADRIKYRAGTAHSWRLRTPYATYANIVRVVYAGALSYNYASHALGFAPACKIS